MTDLPFTEKVASLADPVRREAKITDQTALFVGRFQPFHAGHLKVVEDLSDLFDRVIVVIGSADKSFTKENPFTAGERYEMVWRSIRDRDDPLLNVAIIPIEDSPNNAQWLANLHQYCPPFNVVVGNNAGVLIHFQHTQFRPMRPEIFEPRATYQGTHIRTLMKQGDVETVKGIVPEGTWTVMERVGGFERVQGLHGGELKA